MHHSTMPTPRAATSADPNDIFVHCKLILLKNEVRQITINLHQEVFRNNKTSIYTTYDHQLQVSAHKLNTDK